MQQRTFTFGAKAERTIQVLVTYIGSECVNFQGRQAEMEVKAKSIKDTESVLYLFALITYKTIYI